MIMTGKLCIEFPFNSLVELTKMYFDTYVGYNWSHPVTCGRVPSFDGICGVFTHVAPPFKNTAENISTVKLKIIERELLRAQNMLRAGNSIEDLVKEFDMFEAYECFVILNTDSGSLKVLHKAAFQLTNELEKLSFIDIAQLCPQAITKSDFISKRRSGKINLRFDNCITIGIVYSKPGDLNKVIDKFINDYKNVSIPVCPKLFFSSLYDVVPV
jgi:hypothetical protein